MDENGNPIDVENKEEEKNINDQAAAAEVEAENDTTENAKEEKETTSQALEKEKEEEDSNKKITDYAVVLYENSKIPYAKIHQTMEQLEILLYIPEVILSSITTKFLGNSFYLEAKSQKDPQLYQYLIKLAGPVNVEECGFMVVDTPDDRDLQEDEKEELRPGITRTVKAVKCMIRKVTKEWWSNQVYEICPKIPTKNTVNGSSKQEKEEEKPEKVIQEGDDKEEPPKLHEKEEVEGTPTHSTLIDYIYKDGEKNEELFEFKEKIFLTELFVNKLDEYLTKQEQQSKPKPEDDMPQWLREALYPPPPKENKEVELSEEEVPTEKSSEESNPSHSEPSKKTEPEITLKTSDILFDLDDIDF